MIKLKDICKVMCEAKKCAIYYDDVLYPPLYDGVAEMQKIKCAIPKKAWNSEVLLILPTCEADHCEHMIEVHIANPLQDVVLDIAKGEQL